MRRFAKAFGWPVILGVCGSLFGYLVLSPLAMHMSHRIHSEFSADHMNISDVLLPRLFAWSGPFTLFAGLAGLAIGLLYAVARRECRQREESGKAADLVVNSMAEGLMTIGLDFRIVSANRSLLEAFGRSREEVVGRYCYELSHGRSEPCTGEDHSCPHREVLRTGEKSSVCHVHSYPAGEKRVIEVTGAPVRDAEGNIIQIVEITRDVTEQKKLEEYLRESERHRDREERPAVPGRDFF